ncbi:iron complex transport system ATP-binding protein [Salsuginibacillus halophilus]|uniref:Iron complex transport system ATP-binding protein n=1 Tax=Salsuginibacillus halophilus TaxID=517424 RepID=A0A2P8HL34_9BACI|nr:adenosylcobinamide amidohydrolase [Salsuginibacillus halophilus]PSL46916.1 iron complex transport system ATP-binding protein [Salsuginibacillus halophilus]
MIEVQQLSGGYPDTPVIQNFNVSLERGEFFAMLGPNGSGKTTLFHLLSGRLSKTSGEVLIAGTPLEKMRKLDKAKKMAVLSQEVQVSFDYTVEEVVRLGRYPHQNGFLKLLSAEDQRVIDEVLNLTRTEQFRNTRFRMISGGEKQRVLLAKALAQEPEILLLDEPTNHLDIKHTFELLDLLKTWQVERGVTVFAILHDLNVASLYADRVALLHEGRFQDVGSVDVLRDEEQLQHVYEVNVRTQPHPDVAKPQLLMVPKPEDAPLEPDDFRRQYSIEQTTGHVHVTFNAPVRAASSSVTGAGIDWLKHFCNFHVEKHYNSESPAEDVEMWMNELDIPPAQAAGMMTAVRTEDAVFVEDERHGIRLLAAVTAGVGNAVDITAQDTNVENFEVGTINMMLFLDAHLTDGALINGIASMTEAKTKALHDQGVKDGATQTTATGTSTDSVLLAATQRGEATPYAGSGTAVGRAIGEVVYEAVCEALKKYDEREGRA